MVVHFQGKAFNITVIQAYEPTTNAKEAEAELSFSSQGIGEQK